MPIEVEVNLKIPSLTIRSATNAETRIDNGSVRFIKRVAVDAIPKPGDRLTLSTRRTPAFECTVTRSDWSEEKNVFIVSCSYARRSITPEEHDALLTDPEWSSKQLP